MDGNIVWTSTLDGRYTVTITRTHTYQGELVISDGNQKLHQQTVGLMYGAIFGPDIDDVQSWQQIAMEIVDGRKSGNQIP